MLPQKGKLVPISSLKDDLGIEDMEKAAASSPEWVTPLHNGPFAVFKYILNNTGHVRSGKTVGKHLANGFASLNGLLRDLMVGGMIAV